MQKTFAVTGSLLLFLSVFLYLHDYFVHGKEAQIELWSNNIQEIVAEAEKLKTGYSKIIVSQKFDEPRMYFLFYTAYSPQQYLQEGGTGSGGYLDERGRFDTYQFKFIKATDLAKDILYIWSSQETQSCLKVVQKIPYRFSETALFGILDPQVSGCKSMLN